MPRGGRRAGAGRKPNAAKVAVLLGMDGVRRASTLPPAISAEERTNLLEPRADLSGAAKACWRLWAQKAIDERTLTPATEAGFCELCSRMAIVGELDSRIALLGVGTQDSLPYLKVRQGQSNQLSQSLKDFKLHALGKPATTDKPKAANNPWASIAAAKR